MDKGSVIINGNRLEVLLAISDEEQSKGLMYVKPPVPNMAFVYGQPKINSFWMKSTPSPLDIVFCHKNRIVSICSGTPFSTQLIGGDRFSDLVVEFQKGTCASLGVKEGDPIELQCSKEAAMKVFMLRNGFRL